MNHCYAKVTSPLIRIPGSAPGRHCQTCEICMYNNMCLEREGGQVIQVTTCEDCLSEFAIITDIAMYIFHIMTPGKKCPTSQLISLVVIYRDLAPPLSLLSRKDGIRSF